MKGNRVEGFADGDAKFTEVHGLFQQRSSEALTTALQIDQSYRPFHVFRWEKEDIYMIASSGLRPNQ